MNDIITDQAGVFGMFNLERCTAISTVRVISNFSRPGRQDRTGQDVIVC